MNNKTEKNPTIFVASTKKFDCNIWQQGVEIKEEITCA